MPSTKFEEKFNALKSMTQVVATKASNSLIVLGPGGTGKTHTVLETLDKAKVEFLHYKGYTSNTALYNTIYDNRESLIVFDDADAVFKDTTSLNILKCVLDTYDERTVAWGSPSPAISVPSFTFTGQIIFISNLDKRKINSHLEALMTRCFTVDLTLSREETLRFMRTIARDSEYKGISRGKRLEIFRFLKDSITRGDLQMFSLRTLFQLMDLFKFNPHEWRKLSRQLWKSQ